MAKCIMVQGTMSGAGKSLLVTALCRIFHQDGLRAAPFKSQNMALNSCITADGLEMGRAQAAQAHAAGLEPDVRMNPILLKPSSDTGSQLIVNGEVRGHYSARDYFRMKKSLIPDILRAYESLAAENDIIVIEGAGSPTEINLREDDIVNMGMAELVNAPVLLVGDIDRGGVFAQLYGTVALLTEAERSRIVGTVINKFRGDVEILKPGLSMLEEKTGIPVLGVIPYTRVDIDDEDSLSERLATSGPRTRGEHSPGPGAAAERTGVEAGVEAEAGKAAGSKERLHKLIDIAVVRLPHISNFTDFSPLERHPAIAVRYISSTRELGCPDLVILPGTKNTMGDLLWLRESGLETAIQHLASGGAAVFGVCGGYQMLGETLSDPDQVEHGGTLAGMGLLPCTTLFTNEKRRTRVTASVAAEPFSGAQISCYEIHMGKTTRTGGEPFSRLMSGDSYMTEDGTVYGNVFGTYLHGLFDTGELTEALARWLLVRKGFSAEEVSSVRPVSHREYEEQQYDLLADAVRASLDLDALREAMERFAKC